MGRTQEEREYETHHQPINEKTPSHIPTGKRKSYKQRGRNRALYTCSGGGDHHKFILATAQNNQSKDSITKQKTNLKNNIDNKAHQGAKYMNVNVGNANNAGRIICASTETCRIMNIVCIANKADQRAKERNTVRLIRKPVLLP